LKLAIFKICSYLYTAIDYQPSRSTAIEPTKSSVVNDVMEKITNSSDYYPSIVNLTEKVDNEHLSNKPANIPVILAIVIGGLLGLCLVVCIVGLLLKRKYKRKNKIKVGKFTLASFSPLFHR